MKAEQPMLLVVARMDSRFTRETLRRGGPYEVQGLRWRAKKAARMAQERLYGPTTPATHPDVLAAMNWPRGAK